MRDMPKYSDVETWDAWFASLNDVEREQLEKELDELVPTKMTFYNYFTTQGRAFSRVALLITMVVAFGLCLWQSIALQSGALGVATSFVGFGIVLYINRQYNKYSERGRQG